MHGMCLAKTKKKNQSDFTRYEKDVVMTRFQERRFPRIPFARLVTLRFAENYYIARTARDLSLGGMYVVGAIQEDVGATCQITFIQSGPASDLEPLFKASARVTRVDQEGAAIEFASMTFDCYMFLQTSLLYETDNPLAMCQEVPEATPFRLVAQDASIQNNWDFLI